MTPEQFAEIEKRHASEQRWVETSDHGSFITAHYDRATLLQALRETQAELDEAVGNTKHALHQLSQANKAAQALREAAPSVPMLSKESVSAVFAKYKLHPSTYWDVIQAILRLTAPSAPSVAPQVTVEEMRNAVRLLADRLLGVTMTMSQEREFASAILKLTQTKPPAPAVPHSPTSHTSSHHLPDVRKGAAPAVERERLPALGQQVTYSPSGKYQEWAKDGPYYFAGIQAKPYGKLNVTISTRWPVECNGDLTDGFSPDEWRAALPDLLGAGPGWRTIDQAPKDGRLVDLWVNSARIPNCLWRESCWQRVTRFHAFGMDSVTLNEAPTHFMYPPAPPPATPSVGPK